MQCILQIQNVYLEMEFSIFLPAWSNLLYIWKPSLCSSHDVSAIVQIKYPVLTKRNCVNYVYARSFSFGLMVIYSYVHFQSPTMESKSSQAENYIKDMKLLDHQLLSCLCFYVIVKHIGTHKLFASVVYNILSCKL